MLPSHSISHRRRLPEIPEAGEFLRLFADRVTVAEQVGILERLDPANLTGVELAGMAAELRKRCLRVAPCPPGAVDLCGTGGDRSGTFNISTVAAFVVAGAGVPVAKHGNGAVSSRCGSADCLTALGVRRPGTPQQASDELARRGITFLHAPTFHPVVARVMDARRVLSAQGRKTVFNLLGPLVNPAFVTRQAVGVFCEDLLDPVAEALNLLGVERSMVFHGEGLDEFTLCGRTRFALLDGGIVTHGEFVPEQLGLGRCNFDDLAGGDAAANAALAEALLEGQLNGARREIVLLNAAVAIFVAAADRPPLELSLDRARASLHSGAALRKLQACRKEPTDA